MDRAFPVDLIPLQTYCAPHFEEDISYETCRHMLHP